MDSRHVRSSRRRWTSREGETEVLWPSFWKKAPEKVNEEHSECGVWRRGEGELVGLPGSFFRLYEVSGVLSGSFRKGGVSGLQRMWSRMKDEGLGILRQ